MIAGSFVSGVFKPITTAEYLTPQASSIPHQIYEVKIQTDPMTANKEEQVIQQLISINVPGMQILGVETEGVAGTVRMQVTGSPFFWAPLIALLSQFIWPIIALVIGLVVVFSIPDWGWGVLMILGGGSILFYAISKSKTK